MEKTSSKNFLVYIVVSLGMIILPDKISSAAGNAQAIIIIAGYILLTFSSIITGLILYKEYRSRRILRKAAATDALWNEETLKVHARSVIYKVGYAIDNGDVTNLKDLLTPEFLVSFQKQIDHYKARQRANSINSIDITETTIICCRDYLNNDKDRFVAYAQGTLTESVTDQNPSEELPKKEFSEMYYFDRSGNDWLLDKIVGNNRLVNLLLLTNLHEA
jgi:hypothetical protein